MGAGLFYLLPKSVMGNADDPTFESINRVKKIRRWIFIVACVIMSIISFCKAI